VYFYCSVLNSTHDSLQEYALAYDATLQQHTVYLQRGGR